MTKRVALPSLLCVAALSVATLQSHASTASNPTSAADVISKNVAARGGLNAWRAVKTMTMQGELGIGGNQRATLPTPLPGKQAEQLPSDPRPANEVEVPFTLKLQRPLKTRFEIQFKGQTAVQVFDGTSGWKLRPYLNRSEIEPYTADELKVASAQAALDGPLVDYAAKGTKVELKGMEKVEDRNCYKLELTMKTGQVSHVWIDAQTFLEAKLDGQPRKLDGVVHPVEIYYREYRQVDGLKVPFVLETRVLEAGESRVKHLPIPPEKIRIEKVTVNPPMDDALFAKPKNGAAKTSS